MTGHSGATRSTTRRHHRPEYEGLWEWNLTTGRMHFSAGWVALIGCLEHEVGSAADEWFGRMHPDDRQSVSQQIDAIRSTPADSFELRYRLRHKDGTYRWMTSRNTVVRNDDGAVVRITGTQVDVTAETVLDRNTGLPNRLLLVERATAALAEARRSPTFHFALLLIDAGRPAGPTHDSRSGDPLLNAVARRVETCLRTPESLRFVRRNDLVARMEGDRLAILVEGLIDLRDARGLGERILADLLQPIAVAGRDVRLAPAVGVALSTTLSAHADEVVRDAETALHRARGLGGSHCELFDASVLDAEQSAQQLEIDLGHALERREFVLAYQPIVSIATEGVAGFEALVRWRHPALGIIPPSEFIPMAERTGLIVPLGHWILQEACTQLSAWRARFPEAHDLWLSVNLSANQLRDSDLVEHIESALSASGLPARSLILELTESVAMQDPAAATTVLMQLRANGVRISLDDFGTGYSSLAYLRQFPVDALKIDQSFVRSIAGDADTAAIVRGIVTLAGELGLYVVAEGVEHDVQLETLRALKCELAQGYLFARPLAPDAAEEFIEASAAAPALSSPPGIRPSSAMRRLVGVAAVVFAVMTAGVATWVHGRRSVQPPADLPQPAPIRLTEPATMPSVPQTIDVTKGPPSTNAARSSPAVAANVAEKTTPNVAASVAAPKKTQAAASTSFDVVHLHRIGNCRGHLIVSEAGISFLPAKKGSDDAVTLKYSDFVQSVDERALTIRTADRAFRFSSASAEPKNRAEQLAHLADAISRARTN